MSRAVLKEVLACYLNLIEIRRLYKMVKAFLTIILSLIIMFLLLLAFVIPYAFVPIGIALLIVVLVTILFGRESATISKNLVKKSFYCPFTKKYVEVKFRPSFFTFRPYDDVIKCSVFGDKKVGCKKKCLDLPELKAENG